MRPEPLPSVGRRAALTGALALLPAAAAARIGIAEAPAASSAPVLRLAEAPADAAAIPTDRGPGAVTGWAVADLATGRRLEGHQAEVPRPPASCVKIVTALYGLAALGPAFRFRTAVVATGPVAEGRVQGDLALVGSGDPVLDTDALGDLVAAVHARGVRGVAGRFLVAVGALPKVAVVAPDQPPWVGYNPAVSGLNLNFNRVFLAWGPGDGGPKPSLSAPGRRYSVPIAGIRAAVVPGAGPPAHGFTPEGELWRLPAVGLRGRGSVWLPVRAPGPHAGEVFRALAAEAGLDLPQAEVVARAPGGALLAAHESVELGTILRAMLFHSTNLTAEVVGLRAAQALGGVPTGIAESAAAMGAWARAHYGLRGATFVNHSGLTDSARMAPAEMVQVLLAAARDPGLAAMLRERPLRDAAGAPVAGGLRILAKTGTLHFASGLAGYLADAAGPRLAFAIFAADLAERARHDWAEVENPPGAAAWTATARAQAQTLLRLWAARYG